MDSPPEIEPGWSLFLDLDGTLIDIARSPDSVVVPPGLVDLLARLRGKLGGALAIISGRPIQDIDRVLEPVRFAAGAEHGAVIRHGDGRIEEAGSQERPPAEWIARLARATAAWPGIQIEQKRYAIAIHYRLAPGYEQKVRELVTALTEDHAARFEIVAAKQAFEIRPRAINKGLAVKALMACTPFQGRYPVFVGDDVTDEDGIEMARQLGGLGLHVDRAFGGKTHAVRDWLGRALLDKEN
jgi:trehalose 6-phosphate phosphatase